MDAGTPLFGTCAAALRAQETLRALRRRGAAVAIVTGRWSGTPPADLRDVPVHVVGRASGPGRADAVQRVLKRIGPLDAVVERDGPGRRTGVAFARRAGLPRVCLAGDVAAPTGFPPPRRRAGERGVFVSAVVADLVADAAVETLVEAVALLADLTPVHRLLVVGEGPEAGSLRRSARALGIADHVRFAVAGRPAAVEALLDGAHAGVLTHRVGAARAPLRALQFMAAGLPVVASRASGVEGVVEDGRTGLLVPEEDPQALALRLERLRRDPSLAASLSQAGRRQAAGARAWDTVAAQIIATLRGPGRTPGDSTSG
jgi:hypothetical protein